MDEDRSRRIAQLRLAYEQGILDEDTYHTALSALDPVGSYQATADHGAIAQGGSIAVGERGANVGGDVDGDTLHRQRHRGEGGRPRHHRRGSGGGGEGRRP